MAWYIKRGDVQPPLHASLADAVGAIDVSGAAVMFKAKHVLGYKTINAAAVITDADAGAVEYRWAPGDTDTPGNYRAEFQITFLDASVQTVPSDEWIDLVILPDLD